MKVVPQAFYSSSIIKKVMVNGNCSIIHKKVSSGDLDNHRLLAAHALTVVISGGLMVHNDEGLPLQVDSGEMVLLPKGLYAITDLIPKDNHFEAVVFFFDDQLVDTFLGQKSLHKIIIKSALNPSKFTINKAFGVFIHQTISLYDQVKIDPQMVRGKLLEVLHLISQLNPNGNFLDKILELKANPKKDLSSFMHAHFDKPLGVEAYANLSGRSVSSFRRDFHQQFNVAPKKWLITKRLTKAKTLLSKEQVSVTDVAFHCGFTDIPHFIKSFEKQFSITPKQYALTNRENIQAD